MKTIDEIKLSMQAHDCTYGDTPGCIHCPPDAPCTTHRAERAEAERDAALKSCAAMREALEQVLVDIDDAHPRVATPGGFRHAMDATARMVRDVLAKAGGGT